ncbi:MAG: GGDEF domain-containing protein [Gemmatimonadaceae bacterium]|nr:GGDEF domain-containing protein [Gemmatimonadaceae bacterium]
MADGSRVQRAWAWLLSPPDEVLADAAREGELRVAFVRTWLSLLLLLIPLLSLAADPDNVQHYVGLTVCVGLVAAAVVLERAVRGGLHRPGLPFLTATLDVSFVSLGLVLFWLVGFPIVTTNSRVIFEAYFIAIAASSLRYDPRVCAVAGGAAMAQYLALSFGTWALFGGSALDAGVAEYGRFDWATQLSRVVMLLAMTVIALAIVERTTRLRRLSTFDRLTGLFNRPYVEDRLATEVARVDRTGGGVIAAILDVDHFKAFNDTHGHAGGDAALRHLARVLREALRRSDVVARYGGEEFLILMPATSMAAALEKLDEVRVSVGLSDIRLPRGATARITVSIGVAGGEGERLGKDDLLDLADKRLYTAKEAGRNRVVGA